MNVIRMYTGDDGRSHFEYITMPEGEQREVREIPLPAFKRVVLRRGITRTGRWQTAPRRQWVITLQGRIEIEVADGKKRVFGPGDVLIAEDTTGEGHRVEVLGDEVRVALTLELE